MSQHNQETNLYAHTTTSVYLALGSNVGDRLANLRAAVTQLPPQVVVARCSAVYETEPAYVADQARFLNMVAQTRTALAPHELLAFAKNIEQQVGRTTTFRYGPRVVDLDILLYGKLHLDTPDLVIPHPRMAERAFVLVPLAELVPDLMLPEQTASVAALAKRVGQQGEIVRVVGHI